MAGYLFRNCAAIVPSATAPVLRGADMLIVGKAIAAIGHGLSAGPLPEGTEVIDASGWFVYPGLINTHHHFFQCFHGFLMVLVNALGLVGHDQGLLAVGVLRGHAGGAIAGVAGLRLDTAE